MADTPRVFQATDEELAELIEREKQLEAHIHECLAEALNAAVERFGREYAYYYIDGQLRTTYDAVPKRPKGVYRKAKLSHALQKQVWERDAYRCKQCGDWQDLTVDHIIPESQGGPTKIHNLQTLCRSCNSKKGTS